MCARRRYSRGREQSRGKNREGGLLEREREGGNCEADREIERERGEEKQRPAARLALSVASWISQSSAVWLPLTARGWILSHTSCVRERLSE